MIYKLIAKPLGISIILLSIILFIADVEFSYRDYDLASTFNPFEPRYEMLKIQQSKDVEKMVLFYKKNIRNPYVVEYILLSNKNNPNIKEYWSMLELASRYYPNTIKIQQLIKDYSETVSK